MGTKNLQQRPTTRFLHLSVVSGKHMAQAELLHLRPVAARELGGPAAHGCTLLFPALKHVRSASPTSRASAGHLPLRNPPKTIPLRRHFQRWSHLTR